MKKWLAATLCTLALGPTVALGEADSFGLGTGDDLVPTFVPGENIINSYAQVTGPLAPGDISVPVGACVGNAACFSPGDLVMVLQTTGLVPTPTSGDTSTLKLVNPNPVGRWEFARLKTVSGTALELTAPLLHDYATNVTQVIRVPEYTDVTIALGQNITASAWNGSTGGVVAFLATGVITNGGSITAARLGFRGGAYVADNGSGLGCTGLDEPIHVPDPVTSFRGARKGEGFAITRYGASHTGYGNVANAGGGGVCSKTGGGGGGNGGAGGQGGWSDVADGSRPYGGLGGAEIEHNDGSLLTRLTLGGGGGAGHGDVIGGGSGVPGGRGGGIVFIRAKQLTGTGSIVANGESAGLAADGSSGGGAGGTLHLRFTGDAACASSSSVVARGGLGGNSEASQVGPGGGGGGGRLLFQAAGGTCVTTTSPPFVGGNNVSGANPGSQQDTSIPNYGAQLGQPGDFDKRSTGFVVPPVPEVLTPAPGFTNNPRPVITGTARANTTVIIYIDGVEAGRVTSDALGNYSFTPTTNLPEGSRSVQAATEVEGVQSPRSTARTFTVDLTPPDTAFVSTPPDPTNMTSATFEFTYGGTEPGPVTYQCRLDTEADFTACPNPKAYAGLGQGSHTLLVRAVDAAGNVDPEPARYVWTVDTTPPDTEVTAGPARYTRSTNASLSFTYKGTETGPMKYECKLVTEPAFTSCTSPKLYTGLGDGTYTFEVRAVDAAGNVDPSPATHTWTVDTTAPMVSIVSGPEGTTRETSATFDFNSNEAGTAPGVTYLCKLDTEADFTPCPDPKTYTGLGEGAHRLEVIAEDAAGNRSEPAVRDWTVDLTAPNTVISSNPAKLTREASATFEFSVETPEPGVTYQCKLDTEADFTPCTSPRTYTGLADGERTFQVRAVDAVGNVESTPASYTWTVDTTAPAAPVVSAPANGATLDTLTPALTGTAEPGSTVTVIIDGQVVGTVKADASGNWSYTPTTPLSVGPHEVKVRATDEAGNEGPTSGGRSFTIVQDNVAPETTIVSGPSGTTPERGATFELGSNEPGVTYECSLDGAAFTPCTSPVTYTNLTEGEHTFQVRARDAAGNVDATPDTRTWTVRNEANTGNLSFRGDGFGCSATGGDASLVLLSLGTFLALARRRRR